MAFLEVGASDFALKPIKAPDIISRIRLHLRLLEQGRVRQEEQGKGMPQSMLTLVEDYLHAQSELLTANDAARGTELAYRTVYRYL